MREALLGTLQGTFQLDAGASQGRGALQAC